MGPAGTLPESLNGRLAMVGFVAALAQEKLHAAHGHSLTVSDLLAKPGAVGLVLGLVALVQLASVAPLAQGAEPRDAKAGPFRAQAELLNGRLAMLALTGGRSGRRGLARLSRAWCRTCRRTCGTSRTSPRSPGSPPLASACLSSPPARSPWPRCSGRCSPS